MNDENILSSHRLMECEHLEAPIERLSISSSTSLNDTANINKINSKLLSKDIWMIKTKCSSARQSFRTRRYSAESDRSDVNHLLIIDNDKLRMKMLEAELCDARLEILEKDKKCNALVTLQSKVDNEVQELTGALFQEAYRMVNTAEERTQTAERLLAEARLKVDMLENEVLGLKKMVVDTNTPSKRSSSSKSTIMMRFLNNSLSAKSIDSPNPSPPKKTFFFHKSTNGLSPLSTNSNVSSVSRGISSVMNEIDPLYYKEFTFWRENALGFDENCAFLRRILREDVEPCLVFSNKELSNRVLVAVKANTLEIEPCSSMENGTNNLECALSKIRQACPYRLRLSSNSEWQFISLLARNKIAAVCDFFTYIRYLHQGIIKPSINDSYWCIINLRKNITLAKLGLHFVLKMNTNFTINSTPTSPTD